MLKSLPACFRSALLSSLSLAALFCSGHIHAQTALPDINVFGTRDAPAAPAETAAAPTPVGARQDGAATVFRVDEGGINLATGGGGTNVLRSVSNLPGVMAPAIDPYSLANLPGGNKGIRIRGALSQHGDSLSTVDGLPLSGINPGVGNTWLINNENLSGVTLYQGPVPSNVNSYFTSVGVID